MAHQVVADYTKVSENANVKVFVRARPAEPQDEPAEELFELGAPEPGGRVRKLSMKQWRRTRNEDGEHEQWGGVGGNVFQFDNVFWCDEKQTTIFETVCREQVDHILKGYNACCFAYGQTGSGKTHTMFFPRGGQDRSDHKMHGLIQRAVDYLFTCLESSGGTKSEVKVSFLEVYCDTLRDLGKASLSNSTRLSMSRGPSTEKTSAIYQGAAKQRGETFGLGMRGSSVPSTNTVQPVTPMPDMIHEKTKGHWYELKEEIREDKDGNVFVKSLAKIPVKNSAEVLLVIDRGLRLRATESTSMNDTSSRSHTVFTIEVAMKCAETNDALAGKLHLVDLAGSERLKKSDSSGIRMEEALHINKSLTALGKVIVSLDPAQAGAHVPYRDSKLTRLLQNALGGDSYTSVLATIRPTRSHAEECLSTLQFANRCRKVANNPRVHRLGETDFQSNKAKDEQIVRLRAEIERLKEFTRKLKQRLAQAGLNLEEIAECGGTGSVESPTHDYSPAQIQAVVSGAVLAAMRAVGIPGAVIDESTGGVRLSDGRLLEGTLPGAFVRYYSEADQPKNSSNNHPNRRSAVLNTVAARIAKAMGFSSPQDLPQALITPLVEREDEFLVLKRKLESTRCELEILRKEIDLGKRQITSVTLGAQRLESDSKNSIISVANQMGEQLRVQEEIHAQQLQALVQEKDAIINDITPMKLADVGTCSKLPPNPVVDMSRRVTAARDAVQRAEGRCAGSETSIGNLKMQYEYWLNKKDRDSARFISQLNLYRTNMNAQLETADRELLVLWNAVEHHSRVLRRVRQGKYPLHQLGTNVAAPAIPPNDLPLSTKHLILTRLPATFRSMRKGEWSQSREKNSRYRNETDIEFDAGTRGLPSKAKSLEQTCSATARATPDPLHQSFLENINDLNIHTLRNELVQSKHKLRDYEMRLDREVKECVVAELSAHTTVQYMRDLEELKKAADNKASAQAWRYTQLRVAYEAQKQKPTKSVGGPHSEL